MLTQGKGRRQHPQERSVAVSPRAPGWQPGTFSLLVGFAGMAVKGEVGRRATSAFTTPLVASPLGKGGAAAFNIRSASTDGEEEPPEAGLAHLETTSSLNSPRTVPRLSASSFLCACAVSVLVTLMGTHLFRGVHTHVRTHTHTHTRQSTWTHPAITTIWDVETAACARSPWGCLFFLHRGLFLHPLPLRTSHLHTSPS